MEDRTQQSNLLSQLQMWSERDDIIFNSTTQGPRTEIPIQIQKIVFEAA